MLLPRIRIAPLIYSSGHIPQGDTTPCWICLDSLPCQPLTQGFWSLLKAVHGLNVSRYSIFKVPMRLWITTHLAAVSQIGKDTPGKSLICALLLILNQYGAFVFVSL